VPSGAVRVLASWPTFDANRFDADYAALAGDEVDQPLLNRATQWAIEPGSTVKPIVGLGAIADGLCKPHEGIECTGYMMLRGRPLRTRHRCWVASNFAAAYGDEAIKHHRIPSGDPHKGHDGNPDGFLTFSDALERSCNVYFETLAGRMGIGGLSKWMSRFGLGRRTGIGIAESRGWIPDGQSLSRSILPGETWHAGIGQGQVGATALQMANVAATIARDGVWVRPHLVDGSTVPTTRPASMKPDGPDRVDLGLPPEAITEAKRGMLDVVHSLGGTATYDGLARKGIKIAGKTGSATAAPFRTPMRNARGERMYDNKRCPVNDKPVDYTTYLEHDRQRVGFCSAECAAVFQEDPTPYVAALKERKNQVFRWVEYKPLSPQNRDGYPRWYRGFGPEGLTVSHAWFIGYAPAENPKVAFAVMVEYGGSGGHAAGCVASGIIDACIKHGYLQATAKVAEAR